MRPSHIKVEIQSLRTGRERTGMANNIEKHKYGVNCTSQVVLIAKSNLE